jgi:hypothetical protein
MVRKYEGNVEFTMNVDIPKKIEEKPKNQEMKFIQFIPALSINEYNYKRFLSSVK